MWNRLFLLENDIILLYSNLGDVKKLNGKIFQGFFFMALKFKFQLTRNFEHVI